MTSITPPGSPDRSLAAMSTVRLDSDEGMRHSSSNPEVDRLEDRNKSSESSCWTVLCAPFRFVRWLFGLCCCWCRSEDEQEDEGEELDNDLSQNDSRRDSQLGSGGDFPPPDPQTPVTVSQIDRERSLFSDLAPHTPSTRPNRRNPNDIAPPRPPQQPADHPHISPQVSPLSPRAGKREDTPRTRLQKLSPGGHSIHLEDGFQLPPSAASLMVEPRKESEKEAEDIELVSLETLEDELTALMASFERQLVALPIPRSDLSYMPSSSSSSSSVAHSDIGMSFFLDGGSSREMPDVLASLLNMIEHQETAVSAPKPVAPAPKTATYEEAIEAIDTCRQNHSTVRNRSKQDFKRIAQQMKRIDAMSQEKDEKAFGSELFYLMTTTHVFLQGCNPTIGSREENDGSYQDKHKVALQQFLAWCEGVNARAPASRVAMLQYRVLLAAVGFIERVQHKEVNADGVMGIVRFVQAMSTPQGSLFFDAKERLQTVLAGHQRSNPAVMESMLLTQEGKQESRYYSLLLVNAALFDLAKHLGIDVSQRKNFTIQLHGFES